MIYWNVSVPLLAAVTTGGTVLLPCGITYEEYREDLLSYGYTPLKCEREEYNYNSKEIDWKELCKSKVGAKPQTHYPFARWKQPVSGHVFKVPVNLSLKKDDIPIALLMLSAPTNTEAIKTDAIKTPIGDNPANMATTIPAYPKPGERSAVR